MASAAARLIAGSVGQRWKPATADQQTDEERDPGDGLCHMNAVGVSAHAELSARDHATEWENLHSHIRRLRLWFRSMA